MERETAREHGGSPPPHAPETGWSRRLLGAFHVTGVFWYRFHRWGVAFLPSWGVGVFITLFTSVFFVFLLRIRAAIASNLEAVLGPCGVLERQRRIWRTMWAFAWCLSERYERLATERPFHVAVEGMEHWEAVSRSSLGFLLATAHLGNYEVGSMLPADREARVVHLVREREIDPEAQRFLEETFARFGTERYRWHFESDDPLQGLALLEALRRGEIVAVQGDRPRAGASTVGATLFGRPFVLPAGPAALARAADVPILPAFVIRVGRRRYRLVLRPPVRPTRTSERRADLERTAVALGEAVEWAIRVAPHQWFCFRRLWP